MFMPSIIGLRPVIAAPMPIPMNPFSTGILHQSPNNLTPNTRTPNPITKYSMPLFLGTLLTGTLSSRDTIFGFGVPASVQCYGDIFSKGIATKEGILKAAMMLTF